MRLAIVASHPIQYQAPLFRKLASMVDLDVFYAFTPKPEDQSRAGFSVAFEWDVDLLSGYRSAFLANVSASPEISFSGCDTPEIGAVLRAGNYDVVLVLGWYLKSFVQAVWACKRAAIPVMVRGDNHLLEPRSRAKELAKALMYPPALRVFDAALYVGQRSKEYFRHYGYPERRLFFSPHGVDEAAFRQDDDARARVRRELGIFESARVALFAGKLIPRKRVADLIRAAALLQDRDERLDIIVAGSGSLEDELKRMAGELQVAAHFVGFQNQSTIPAMYAACDVMVLPSDNESWGLVGNEALASGRPVVIADIVGCAPDLAGDGKAGRTYKTGDASALADAICDVFRAPPRLEDVAARARLYSIETAASGILEAAAYVMRARKSS